MPFNIKLDADEPRPELNPVQNRTPALRVPSVEASTARPLPLLVFKFQANKFNFRLSTGFHDGSHNNEYGGTLEFFQWRKSYRLSRPTEDFFSIENLNENLNEVLPKILIFNEVLDEVLDF